MEAAIAVFSVFAEMPLAGESAAFEHPETAFVGFIAVAAHAVGLEMIEDKTQNSLDAFGNIAPTLMIDIDHITNRKFR